MGKEQKASLATRLSVIALIALLESTHSKGGNVLAALGVTLLSTHYMAHWRNLSLDWIVVVESSRRESITSLAIS